MDTSAEENIATDTLGRRTGPRRQYTLEEKRRIVEETQAPGASVSLVARKHDLNANQIFAWRRLFRQGLLKAHGPGQRAPMLPVKVETPTVLPSERAVRATRQVRAGTADDCIEIKLASGHSLIVRGQVDVKSLAHIVDVLSRR